MFLSPDSPSLSSRGTQRSNISLTKVEPWTDHDSLELISYPGSGKGSRKITPTPPLEKEIQASKPVENGLLYFANDSFSGVENVNALDREGLSALHRAVRVDDVATVVFLLDNDADINLAGKSGFTPLHTAVKYVYGIKSTTGLITPSGIVEHFLNIGPFISYRVTKNDCKSHYIIYMTLLSSCKTG